MKTNIPTQRRAANSLEPGTLPPIDESIPGCKDTAFIAIWPPSAAELRCRGLDADGQPVKVEKRTTWTPGEQLPEIDETIPGCKDAAFIDIFPPSDAELRCRGIDVDGVSKISEAVEKKREAWVEGEQLPPVDETIPGCKDTAFIMIYPPSQAELYCRGVVDKDGNPIVPE